MKKTLIASAVGMAVVSFSASATQPTYSSNDELNVQNRCIVSFHDNIDASQVKGLAKGLAQRANASVRHVYQNSIKGFTINAPCHAAEKAFGGDMNVKSMSLMALLALALKASLVAAVAALAKQHLGALPALVVR